MITAMSEITQDPAEAGNALKILAMRLRGAKTEIEAAGEDTDGMAESTSKLREQIKALTNVDGNGGFDIMLNEDYEMVLAKSAQIGGHPEEDNTEGKAQIHGKKFRNYSYIIVFENPLTTTVA